MKVKVGELFGLNEALANLGKAELPIADGLKVARMAKTLLNEAATVYDMRNTLVIKYGDLDEKDGQVKVKDNSPKRPDFLKDLAELAAQEIEVAVEVITLQAKSTQKCPNCGQQIQEDIKIDVGSLMGLEQFLEVQE